MTDGDGKRQPADFQATAPVSVYIGSKYWPGALPGEALLADSNFRKMQPAAFDENWKTASYQVARRFRRQRNAEPRQLGS